MATSKHIDEITGTETTGHEWDGITELNTPMPTWWLWTFYACILFAIIYMVLFPAWPWLSGYTKGLLGYSSRERHLERMADIQQERSVWYDKIQSRSVEEIGQDYELVEYAMAGGRTIFADNCAPCHGAGGAGAPNYPVLVDDAWIWGGTLPDIYQTIRYGIRNDNPDTRVSEMPAFGADGLLTDEQIAAVADYVLSLSGHGSASPEGTMVFAENCAACHGDDGKGLAELGAPNLTDSIWLYGGSRDAVIGQITHPRLGVMPPWVERLDDVEIKQAAVYVHSLGGGQ
jgi:cytochrome c oxidase cbb3-type subunit III